MVLGKDRSKSSTSHSVPSGKSIILLKDGSLTLSTPITVLGKRKCFDEHKHWRGTFLEKKILILFSFSAG